MTTPTGAIEFRASITSMTVSRNAAGMLTTAVNVEGEAGAYGPFAGTMVVAGANKGGAWHYDGFGMPADGSNLSGTWNGSYEFVGPGRWRTNGAGMFHTDTEMHSSCIQGEVNLEKREWRGQIEVR